MQPLAILVFHLSARLQLFLCHPEIHFKGKFLSIFENDYKCEKSYLCQIEVNSNQTSG